MTSPSRELRSRASDWGGCGLDGGTEINGTEIDEIETAILMALGGEDMGLSAQPSIFPTTVRPTIIIMGAPNIVVPPADPPLKVL